MILPVSLLRKVEYYEACIEERSDTGVNTVITLNFKSWWRRKKVMKFRWSMKSSEGGTTSWSETRDCQELKECLKKYFEWTLESFQ